MTARMRHKLDLCVGEPSSTVVHSVTPGHTYLHGCQELETSMDTYDFHTFQVLRHCKHTVSSSLCSVLSSAPCTRLVQFSDDKLSQTSSLPYWP